MVRTGKSSFTHKTLEWANTGVLPYMAGEFIRAGKLPATTIPFTYIRLLPCREERSVLFYNILIKKNNVIITLIRLKRAIRGSGAGLL